MRKLADGNLFGGLRVRQVSLYYIKCIFPCLQYRRKFPK